MCLANINIDHVHVYALFRVVPEDSELISALLNTTVILTLPPVMVSCIK